MIVEEEVWVYIMPPPIVGSFGILSGLDNPMEGILGNLSISLSISYQQEQRGKLP